MKMVVAIVQDKDSNRLSGALVKANLRATKLASTGGFLRAGNTTFMIGVEDDQVSTVLNVIRNNCKVRDQLVTPVTPLSGTSDSYMPLPVEVQVGEQRYSCFRSSGSSIFNHSFSILRYNSKNQ
ncbi:hypothetical protein PAV_2c06030 [Paenibacillus alvei DSM 29]|nr:hypothetical protein PAV_2c06030 [Paenibacillus alvei DSM 29]